MSLTIYKASAGSGKTFTLAATYIAHMIEDGTAKPHRHQLAVTFTNKATAEMKGRILECLYSIANGTDPNDGFFCAVKARLSHPLDDDTIRSRARTILTDIIHDYDHFHVTTIDAFFQSLLSSLAHDLGLSASYKVELGGKEVLSKAVDRLLAGIDADSKQLSWITRYVRDKMEDGQSWNVGSELKKLAAEIIKESYMQYSPLLNAQRTPKVEGAIELTEEFLGRYKATLAKIRKEQYALIARAATVVDNVIRHNTAAPSLPVTSADDADRDGISYDKISHGNDWVKPFVARAAGIVRAPKAFSEPSSTIRGYADGSKNLLKGKPSAADTAKGKRVAAALAALVETIDSSTHTINSCRLSEQNLNPLLLLDTINAEVDALNAENNSILLAYTPLLFDQLSKDTDASFVFERAGTQFRHVMIDEFQDTSRLQWSNIRHLLVESLASGNSCMLVGDVKQGIYRFRGGDWNTLASFGSGDGGSHYHRELNTDVAVETLKTNFRSGRVVVDFNNSIFTHAPAVTQRIFRQTIGLPATPPAAPADTDAAPVADDILPSELNIERIYPTPDPDADNHEVTQLPHNEGGYVRVEFYNRAAASATPASGRKGAATGAEAAAEADTDICREASVAAQIVRLNAAGESLSDMAILVRNRMDATPLMDYFIEHHGPDSTHPIALISEEAFLLQSSSAVMTIINALRFVADTTDTIALEYLRRRCPHDTSIDEIRQLLTRWHDDKFDGIPLYEAACRLAGRFHLNADPGQSPYLYTFLDAVLTYIDDNTADLDKFLQYWDESLSSKAIPSPSVDGVRILTIHKSKGLAFHTVLIPYCDWKLDGSDSLLWTTPRVAPYNTLPVLPVTMKKEANNSIYRDVYRQEQFDIHVENLNLLYVAFTRTQQNLLVWADCKTSKIAKILAGSISSTDDIVEYGTFPVRPAAGTGGKASAGGKAEPANPLKYKPSPIDVTFHHRQQSLDIRQSGNAERHFRPLSADDPETAKQQEDYRLAGIALHHLMSTIETPADIDATLADLSQQGLLPARMSVSAIKQLVVRRLRQPLAARWFDGSHHLYRECSIISRVDGKTVTRRPDRVMVRGDVTAGTDETIVVDFKFGKSDAAHRTQVLEYMDLLRRQGRHHVRGYLWYFYSGKIEEVK